MTLSPEEVKKAVEALKLYVSKKETSTINILETNHPLTLQLTLKHIPKMKSKLVKIQLPTSLITESSDVCLFVKDVTSKSKDTEESVLFFKELLFEKKENRISAVIPLQVLKNEYKSFEAKRKLSNSHSVFLADERIIRLLPAQLGKHFYDRSRQPVQVNLLVGDLRKEIDRALHTVVCNMSMKGASFHVAVAHTDMKTNLAVDNVMSTFSKLLQTVPGGADNIRGVVLKTDTSPGLPLYQSDDFTAREAPVAKKQKLQVEPEQVATLAGAKVLVTATGRVKIIGDNDAAAAAKVGSTPGQRKTNKSPRFAKNKKKKNAKPSAGSKKSAATTPPSAGNGTASTAEKKISGKAKPAKNANSSNGGSLASHSKKQKVNNDTVPAVSNDKQDRKRKRNA